MITYAPTYTLTRVAVFPVAAMAEQVWRLSVLPEQWLDLRLLRINHIHAEESSRWINKNSDFYQRRWSGSN